MSAMISLLTDFFCPTNTQKQAIFMMLYTYIVNINYIQIKSALDLRLATTLILARGTFSYCIVVSHSITPLCTALLCPRHQQHHHYIYKLKINKIWNAQTECSEYLCCGPRSCTPDIGMVYSLYFDSFYMGHVRNMFCHPMECEGSVKQSKNMSELKKLLFEMCEVSVWTLVLQVFFLLLFLTCEV